jgi:hypothetical protein
VPQVYCDCIGQSGVVCIRNWSKIMHWFSDTQKILGNMLKITANYCNLIQYTTEKYYKILQNTAKYYKISWKNMFFGKEPKIHIVATR